MSEQLTQQQIETAVRVAMGEIPAPVEETSAPSVQEPITEKTVEVPKTETNTSEITAETVVKDEAYWKKKYHSDITKERQKLDEVLKANQASTATFKPESVQVVEQVVDAKLQAVKIDQYEKAEKDAFIASRPDLKSNLQEIEAVRNSFPNMSWNTAATLYIADTNPQMLVPQTAQAPILGNIPNAVANPELSYEARMTKAMAELAEGKAIIF